MQKGFLTSKTPRFDTNQIIKRINKIAKLFRKVVLPVIYIQQDGTNRIIKH